MPLWIFESPVTWALMIPVAMFAVMVIGALAKGIKELFEPEVIYVERPRLPTAERLRQEQRHMTAKEMTAFEDAGRRIERTLH